MSSHTPRLHATRQFQDDITCRKLLEDFIPEPQQRAAWLDWVEHICARDLKEIHRSFPAPAEQWGEPLARGLSRFVRDLLQGHVSPEQWNKAPDLPARPGCYSQPALDILRMISLSRWAHEGSRWYEQLWQQAGLSTHPKAKDLRNQAIEDTNQLFLQALISTHSLGYSSAAVDGLLHHAQGNESLRNALLARLDTALDTKLHPDLWPFGSPDPTDQNQITQVFFALSNPQDSPRQRMHAALQRWGRLLRTEITCIEELPDQMEQVASLPQVKEFFPRKEQAGWVMLQAVWPLLHSPDREALQPLYSQLQAVAALEQCSVLGTLYENARHTPAQKPATQTPRLRR